MIQTSYWVPCAREFAFSDPDTQIPLSMQLRHAPPHSRLTQRDRLTSLSLFRSSVIPVLVSTDVGARGLPDEPEVYTHRVGRTARAGRGGIAFNLIEERIGERHKCLQRSTRLVEMELPEDNVLEKLNKVATAKRQAYMVSEMRMRFVEILTWRSGAA
ncbi:hypothetical protein BC826DRAFT_1021986 [Russula brevipes]|nr:hypothetical protein BC826DRAFT_1021986 [Russula brevipes]